VTFPKYVWATKCYAYQLYIVFQKSHMAAQKPEVCKPFVVILQRMTSKCSSEQ